MSGNMEQIRKVKGSFENRFAQLGDLPLSRRAEQVLLKFTSPAELMMEVDQVFRNLGGRP
jgi:hypothetical protein